MLIQLDCWKVQVKRIFFSELQYVKENICFKFTGKWSTGIAEENIFLSLQKNRAQTELIDKAMLHVNPFT